MCSGDLKVEDGVKHLYDINVENLKNDEDDEKVNDIENVKKFIVDLIKIS